MMLMQIRIAELGTEGAIRTIVDTLEAHNHNLILIDSAAWERLNQGVLAMSAHLTQLQTAALTLGPERRN